MFFPVFVSLVILQRLAELVYAKRNRKIMLSKGAVEYDRNGYNYVVLLHSLFFISLVLENYLLSKNLNIYWYIYFLLFGTGQLFRYLAMFALKENWNTRIIVLKDSEPVKKGLFKYFKHPNYIGVVIELFSMPLIFSCYITAIIYTLLNAFALKRRMRIEESLIYK